MKTNFPGTPPDLNKIQMEYNRKVGATNSNADKIVREGEKLQAETEAHAAKPMDTTFFPSPGKIVTSMLKKLNIM